MKLTNYFEELKHNIINHTRDLNVFCAICDNIRDYRYKNNIGHDTEFPPLVAEFLKNDTDMNPRDMLNFCRWVGLEYEWDNPREGGIIIWIMDRPDMFTDPLVIVRTKEVRLVERVWYLDRYKYRAQYNAN